MFGGATAIRQRSIIPGFELSLGVTLSYLGLIVIIPLCVLLLNASDAGWAKIWAELSSPRTLAAFRVSFGIAFLAAGFNAGFGFIVAWVLVRYQFLGRRFIDAMIDLPFALPTAVAGISLTQLYAEKGWLGSALAATGIKVAFTPLGILVALSLVRELGPVVAGLLFASRAGSAITAEIGLMKTTEQLTAMDMMAVSPMARVIAPRFWAGVISMPILSLLFSAMGVFGGYLVMAGSIRFAIEFIRINRRLLGPLTLAQLISLSLIVAGTVLIVRYRTTP